jgi:excisionase family DNA binding protein
MTSDWTRRTFVTAAQAADFLSVHVRTVYRYAAAGRLPAHYVAGSRAVRYARTDVEQLLVAADRDDDEGKE